MHKPNYTHTYTHTHTTHTHIHTHTPHKHTYIHTYIHIHTMCECIQKFNSLHYDIQWCRLSDCIEYASNTCVMSVHKWLSVQLSAANVSFESGTKTLFNCLLCSSGQSYNHTHIHTHIYIYIYTYIHTYTYTYTYTYTHARNMHICVRSVSYLSQELCRKTEALCQNDNLHLSSII